LSDSGAVRDRLAYSNIDNTRSKVVASVSHLHTRGNVESKTRGGNITVLGRNENTLVVNGSLLAGNKILLLGSLTSVLGQATILVDVDNNGTRSLFLGCVVSNGNSHNLLSQWLRFNIPEDICTFSWL